MKQIDELWQERVQAYIKELRRYLKYMFNDHLLFVFIFGGGAAIYYYSQWVQTLSSSFPIGIVMGVILGIFLAASPIQTLLKEADIVFLLALETKLDRYFKKGIRMSFIIQAYLILLVLAALMPMYVKVTNNGFNSFFWLLAIMLALKFWNLNLHWHMLKLNDPNALIMDQIIRFAINAVLVYFIVEQASYWLIGATLLVLIAFTMYFKDAVKNKLLKWSLLIQKEQTRMQMFYRSANMFTDVPHLKGEVKRRRWLDFMFSGIPYGSGETYRFLYSRTLVRTSEYSGLIVRLTLIAAVLTYLSDNLYVSIGICVLFLYLTGFQLLPLIRHHELKIWTNLYPIPKGQNKQALLGLILTILFIQAVLFAIVALISGSVKDGAIIGGLGVLVAFAFANLYAPKRI